MTKKGWVFLGVGAVVLIGVIGGLSSNNNQPTSSTNISSNTAAEKPETTKEFSQNEKVTFENVEYSILNVEKTTGKNYDKAKEGKEFVIVSLRIENKSDKKIPFNPIDWKMENSNGQETSQDFTIVDSDTALNSGDLNPGGKIEGTIAFEQPKGDMGLKINYYSNVFNDSPSFKIKLD